MVAYGITGEAFWGRNMNVRLTFLNRTFREIRRKFFPRWDLSGKWKPKLGVPEQLTGCACHGYCESDSKTIYVNERIASEGGDELELLFVHEICHAVTPGGHGKTWMDRLRKAADRAKALGMSRLAGLLSQEIKGYLEPEKIMAEQVYDEIEKYVEHHPNGTYENAVEVVSSGLGLRVDDFERHFRRSRSMYEEAVASMNRPKKAQS